MPSAPRSTQASCVSESPHSAFRTEGIIPLFWGSPHPISLNFSITKNFISSSGLYIFYFPSFFSRQDLPITLFINWSVVCFYYPRMFRSDPSSMIRCESEGDPPAGGWLQAIMLARLIIQCFIVYGANEKNIDNGNPLFMTFIDYNALGKN